MRVFISAGEASGDLYASRVVEALRARYPDAEFFGCAGPRAQAAGVRAIVDSRELAVAGLIEVVPHIPRIWLLFRKLVQAAKIEKPDIAVLTDSPDFHLRLAKKLKALGIPIVYLIAPQAWAWREGRVKTLRRTVSRLLCIFPFEEEFFSKRGVPTTYIGHPLAGIVKPTMTRAEFLSKFAIADDRPLIALLPGSRHGEVARHMPYLIDAAERIARSRPATFVLALPPGFGFETSKIKDTVKFWERNQSPSIQVLDGQVIEGKTWDTLAYCDVALAASGTVTMEAALLGAPMVTFYRVNELSWKLGRWLVRSPFLSMVNLVAGRGIAAELIQQDMTGERIAAEAIRLLDDERARQEMRDGLAEVRAKLALKLEAGDDPMQTAAEWIERVWRESKQTVPVH